MSQVAYFLVDEAVDEFDELARRVHQPSDVRVYQVLVSRLEEVRNESHALGRRVPDLEKSLDLLLQEELLESLRLINVVFVKLLLFAPDHLHLRNLHNLKLVCTKDERGNHSALATASIAKNEQLLVVFEVADFLESSLCYVDNVFE